MSMFPTRIRTRESDMGLVVVGGRGLDRLQYTVQKSVSSTVVREVSCPVLVVHSDERS